MKLSGAEQPTIRLPVQSPPISRESRAEEAHLSQQAGVEASQTACDGLRGLARQMCYAVEYGVSI
jgi:hypothetical protein